MSLREKIAEKVATIYRQHFPHCPNSEVPMNFGYEVTDQIHEAYKDWFKREIDKLGVISDEEIKKALDNLIASPVVVKKPERAIAQAQNKHDKDTLLRRIE